MAEKAPTNTAKPKVLVADDEQVIANTLAIILNQAGFEARAVFSGEDAVKLLDSFQPDMLISDVIMSEMTGIEAAAGPSDRPAGEAARLGAGGNASPPFSEDIALSFLYFYRRNAAVYGPWLQVLGCYRSQTKDSPFANVNSWCNGCSGANPAVVAECHLECDEGECRIIVVVGCSADERLLRKNDM